MLRCVCVLALVMAAGVASAIVSAAPPAYSLVQLQDLRGSIVGEAQAINDRGQIAGWALGATLSRAVIWTGGVPTDLGTLTGGFASAAYGINNRGQAVGYSETTNCGGSPPRICEHAVLWDNGRMTDLGVLAGDLSRALAINDRGQIVGYSSAPSSAFHAVMWDNGTIVDLGALPGDSVAMANAINNRGQIVGSSRNDLTSRAFLWQAGTMSELPAQSDETAAFDINERGDIAGQSGGPVVWENGTLATLQAPAGTSEGVALGIDDRGQVVGYLRSSAPNTLHVPVIWSNRSIVVLPGVDPVVPSFPSDTIAVAINNAGEVVGHAVRANRLALMWSMR